MCGHAGRTTSAANSQWLGGAAQSNEDGVFDLVLSGGFRGYLDVAPSATIKPELLPAVIYLLEPDANASGNSAALPVVSLWRKDQLEYQAATFGKRLSPSYAHLLFHSLDCQRNPAADTVLSVETITADTFACTRTSPERRASRSRRRRHRGSSDT